jgi:hypothetical protein
LAIRPPVNAHGWLPAKSGVTGAPAQRPTRHYTSALGGVVQSLLDRVVVTRVDATVLWTDVSEVSYLPTSRAVNGVAEFAGRPFDAVPLD